MMKNRTKIKIFSILVLLSLAAIVYTYSLHKISLASSTNGSSSGYTAEEMTERSKNNPVEAAEWVNTLNETADSTYKKAGKNPPWNPEVEEIPSLEDILRSLGRGNQIMDDGTVYITYQDFKEIPSVFCSAHGTPMPSAANTIVRVVKKDDTVLAEKDVTDQGKSTGYLTVEDLNTATVYRNEAEWTDWTREGPDEDYLKTVTSKTYGRFTKKPDQQCTPAEAWVLAELDKNVPGTSIDLTAEVTDEEVTVDPSDISGTIEIDGEEYFITGNVGEEQYLKKDGDKYYKVNVTNTAGGSASSSYVQYAWWKVKTCGIPSTVDEGDKDAGLAAEAEAFEEYVLAATHTTDPKKVPLNEKGYFDIDYRADYKDNHAVMFNSETNKYLIGPYTITYLRACTQQAERAKVSFAGIDSVLVVGADSNKEELLNEDKTSKLQLGKNYKFVYDDEAAHKARQTELGDTDEDYPYPYSDEVFYLEVDYLDDLAFIKSIKFDFQYMTACGKYDLYEGTYLLITWDCYADINPRLVNGSSSSTIMNDSQIALKDAEVSSRKADGFDKKLGTISGTYKSNVDFSKAVNANAGKVTDQYHYGNSDTSFGHCLNITKRGDPVISDSVPGNEINNGITRVTIKIPYSISYRAHPTQPSDDWIEQVIARSVTVYVNDMSQPLKTYTLNSTGINNIEVEYEMAKDKNYREDTIYFVTKYDIKTGSGTTYYNQQYKSYAKVAYYVSILNQNGKVNVYSEDELELDGNKLYFEGMAEKAEKAVDFDPYEEDNRTSALYEERTVDDPKGSIHYEASSTSVVDWPADYAGVLSQYITYGNGGVFTLVGTGVVDLTAVAQAPNGVVTEQIDFTCEVPHMGIDERDNYEVTCDDLGNIESIDYKLYNAFVDSGDHTMYRAFMDDEAMAMVDVLFDYENGLVHLYRKAIAGEDGSCEILILDTCINYVTINVSWNGRQIGGPQPIRRGQHYEYQYKYYLVAREISSQVAQTQINAHGKHEVVDVSTARGKGPSICEPAELDLLDEMIDLRTSVVGGIWIDEDPQKDETKAQKIGIYEEGIEKPVGKNSVEIVLWKVKYEIATGKEVERQKETRALSYGEPVDFITKRVFCDEYGHYLLVVPIVSEEGLDTTKYCMAHDIEFIYDGQTYEATECLVPDGAENKKTREEKLEAFKKTAEETAGPEKDYTLYSHSSYGAENAEERKDFDKYLSEIYGDTVIDTSKVKGATDVIIADSDEKNENFDVATKGKATGGIGGSQYGRVNKGDNQVKEAELNYNAQLFSTDNEYYKTQSGLITHDAEGYVFEQFRFSARISETGLRLPYEKYYHPTVGDFDNHVIQGITYKPVNEYCTQLRLGLMVRNKTDISVNKDLYLANVVVNEQLSTYTYNSLGQLTDEALRLQETIGYRSQKYDIDLYNSDYYYRSSAYDSIADRVTREILSTIKDGTELQVFLTYRLQFTNSSENTNVSINEFTDYYDSTFTLVTDFICDNTEGSVTGSETPKGSEKYEPGKFKKYISSQKISGGENPGNVYEDLETREALTVGYTPYYRKLGGLTDVTLTDTNGDNSDAKKDYYWDRDSDLDQDKVAVKIDTTGIVDTADGRFSMNPGVIKDSKGKEYKSFTYTGLNAYDGSVANPILNGTEGTDGYNPLVLEPGESIEFFVTYIVDQEGFEEAANQSEADVQKEMDRDAANTPDNAETVNITEDDIRDKLVGEKSNIAEVTKYSTAYNYTKTDLGKRHNTVAYGDYQISGRVDRDSAPDNINFTADDAIKYSEDDTEFAPVVDVEIQNVAVSRSLNGVVWEDARKENEYGNGIYDSNEKGIDNIDVTMVEKIRVTSKDLLNKMETGENNLSKFKLDDLSFLDNEFEYIWKHNQIPGFESETRSATVNNQQGHYEFNNFVAGDYVVRFEYGNCNYVYEKNEDGSYKYKEVSPGVFQRIIELDENGVEKLDLNSTVLKYNGSDYKNVAYQATADGSVRINPDPSKASDDQKALIPETNDTIYLPARATLNNEWHDLSKNDQAKNIAENRISDARDYEPQRMRVLAYGRTITNMNGEVLASGIEYTTDVTGENAKDHVTDEYKAMLQENAAEMANRTRMVANTAKLHVCVEKQDELEYKQITSLKGTSKSRIKENEIPKYVIDNIDFGLVERPETRLRARKEIYKIEMLKDDGTTLVLSVECDEDGNIIKTEGNGTIRAEKVAEINKDVLGTNQGLKYIAMESSYLKGLTLLLTYRITVENFSETDYIGTTLGNLKNIQTIYEVANYFESMETEKAYYDGTDNSIPFANGRAIAYGKYLGLAYYTNTDKLKYTDATEKVDMDNKYAGLNKNHDTSAEVYRKMAVVTTTIDQMVDYIDNDISISEEDRTIIDRAWKDTTGIERKNKLSEISFTYEQADVNQNLGRIYSSADNITDDKGRRYVTYNNVTGEEITNNIVQSENELFQESPEKITYNTIKTNKYKEPVTERKDLVYTEIKEDGSLETRVLENVKILSHTLFENEYSGYTVGRTTTTDTVYNNNASLTKELKPGETASIIIVLSKGTSEKELNDMIYDNLSEVLIYSNTAGRRDMQIIPGNANLVSKEHKAYNAGYMKVVTSTANGTREYDWLPHTVQCTNVTTGQSQEIKAERDAYAARDTVRFTEPTGLSLERQRINAIMRIILFGLLLAMTGTIIATVAIVVKRTSYDDEDLIGSGPKE